MSTGPPIATAGTLPDFSRIPQNEILLPGGRRQTADVPGIWFAEFFVIVRVFERRAETPEAGRIPPRPLQVE